jgi:ubiquinone/menaquinone biosynthesis C-methylase UbiE
MQAKSLHKVNLLRALPKPKHDIAMRKGGKNPEVIRISKQFGEAYFDGSREYGYGGYRYDGRWLPVAKDMVDYFDLKPGDRFLDIGCAKGFLLQDLKTVCPGLEVVGLDISAYALQHVNACMQSRVVRGDARRLPFQTGAFSAAVSINTLHNFPKAGVIQGLQEIQRVCGGRAFIQVDSYSTPEEKEIFESWVLTAEFHDYPEKWIAVFQEAGYTGGYHWTIA